MLTIGFAYDEQAGGLERRSYWVLPTGRSVLMFCLEQKTCADRDVGT